MARRNGSDFKFFFADTEPTTANDPTDSAYNEVGQVIDLGIDSESEEVQVTDRDGTSTLTGSLGYTLPGSVHYDPGTTTDAGQDDLWTVHLARGTGYWLMSTEVTGEVCFSGSAQVTNLGLDAGTDEGLICEFTLGGNNAITKGTTA